MSIRKKFLGTILAITLSLSLIFFAIIAPVVNIEFEHHELTAAGRKLQQVEAIFNYQMESLANLVVDLTQWHDSYLFVAGRGSDAVDANTMRNSFVNSAKIDMLLTFDADRNLTHGIFLHKNTGRLEEVDNDLLKTVISQNNIFENHPQGQSITGIVQYGERHLIVAASSVYTGNSDDSFLGIFIVGRFLDDKLIAQLEDMNQYTVDFHPISTGPEDVVQAALALQSSSSPYHLQNMSKKIIKGYVVLRGVAGQSNLMMVVTIDRTLHKKHHDNLPFLFMSILFCCLVFGISCSLFIEVIVLRRFSAIISDINELEKDGYGSKRVRESNTDDEFNSLAQSINNMLTAYETLEEYKIKNKKLELVATFAAGATHELANPISTIAVASGEMLRDLLKGDADNEDLCEDVLLIREKVDRCKFIIKQMSENTGGHMGEEIISFTSQKLIEVTLSQFHESEVRQITVENRIVDTVISMPFYSLCRALRGLLRNSLEASRDGQPISLTCFENTAHLVFSIEDRGHGMDDNTLQHAVDPFFSTKNPGENLGLGLYLAQSLAARFNGDLEMNSTPDHGTTVALTFSKEKSIAHSKIDPQ